MTPVDCYTMEIRCNATGDIRERTYKYGPWDYGQEWYWTEGNFGCDCNRKMEFDRAAGIEPFESDDNYPCGTGSYAARLKGTEEWL